MIYHPSYWILILGVSDNVVYGIRYTDVYGITWCTTNLSQFMMRKIMIFCHSAIRYNMVYHQFIAIYDEENYVILPFSYVITWFSCLWLIEFGGILEVCQWMCVIFWSEGLTRSTHAGRKPCSSTMNLHRSIRSSVKHGTSGWCFHLNSFVLLHFTQQFRKMTPICPLVNKHSYWKWPIEIVDLPIKTLVIDFADLPIKNCDFP